jgi:hypothetical protein
LTIFLWFRIDLSTSNDITEFLYEGKGLLMLNKKELLKNMVPAFLSLIFSDKTDSVNWAENEEAT